MAKMIKVRDISGLKDFGVLKLLLRRLHKIGTEWDSAGNRSLYMDQNCLLVLMWLNKLIVDSLRGL